MAEYRGPEKELLEPEIESKLQTALQDNMPFDLLHPNKTRSRSVHLDHAVASATVGLLSPSPAIATRSSSLAYRENTRPVFRSMLDLEPAPRIAPLKALDLDELRREVMPLSECQPP